MDRKPVLIIIRGIPGSGKTFLGEMIKIGYERMGDEETPLFVQVEADDFFYNGPEYKFDPNRILDAHEYCRRNFRIYIGYRWNIIISNTATTKKEYQYYINYAKEHGYDIQVLDVHSTFKNVHGVPEETLTKMESRFEPFDRSILK